MASPRGLRGTARGERQPDDREEGDAPSAASRPAARAPASRLVSRSMARPRSLRSHRRPAQDGRRRTAPHGGDGRRRPLASPERRQPPPAAVRPAARPWPFFRIGRAVEELRARSGEASRRKWRGAASLGGRMPPGQRSLRGMRCAVAPESEFGRDRAYATVPRTPNRRNAWRCDISVRMHTPLSEVAHPRPRVQDGGVVAAPRCVAAEYSAAKERA